jgi:hypothetical protein
MGCLVGKRGRIITVTNRDDVGANSSIHGLQTSSLRGRDIMTTKSSGSIVYNPVY